MTRTDAEKANAMKLTRPTPEDDARRYCHLAGWHHNGDTRAMLGNGGVVDLPEVMVAFYRHLIAENEHLRKLLEETLQSYRKQTGETGRSVPQFSDPAGE